MHNPHAITKTISFPPGAGGSWLRAVLLDREIGYQSYFNEEVIGKSNSNYNINLVHDIDRSRFDYLYSGSYFFNFYINVIYKYDILQNHLTTKHYSEIVEILITISQSLCGFETLSGLEDLSFDDLIFDFDRFHNSFLVLRSRLGGTSVSNDFLESQRSKFIKSCVNGDSIYQDWNSIYWVCFVLGELEYRRIFPGSLLVKNPDNFSEVSRFAQEHYHHCVCAAKFWSPDTQVILPELSPI